MALMKKELFGLFFLFWIMAFPPETARAEASRVSSLLVEAETGRVLFSENAAEKRYPASLTKMMTLYLVFDALEKGEIQMDQLLTVSKKAAGQPRSRMGLKENSTISVENAIFAMISRSANDAAVVVAEGLAGSEAQFADKMTRIARELGMKNTRFKNASGLHNKDQVTTAQDMAILSMALIQHFPEYYKLFSVRGFRYGKRYYGNHNLVARFYKGGDGLKTGYVDASGYHVVGSAIRDGKRLIGVVMGRNSVRERDRHIFRLLDSGFASLKNNKTEALDSLDQAPFFAPMKEEKTGASQSEYRQLRIAAQKLSEGLDRIASVDQSLQTEQNTNIIKHAIIDWGKKK
ncbi:MAG: D-alanyl-D-alanine carboxypeptidase [Alphaproteobacteria bacterium]|nr:D-alanyl-D-alanine carboxypeptidase [Alphaproteobacteria bacterium]